VNRRLQHALTLLLCVGLLPILARADTVEELTLASAIDKAGLQRMLTQRIGKAYCQIGLGIQPDQSQEQLDQAVAMFDGQLAELRAFAPTQEVRSAVAQVEMLWEPVKAVATAPVTREGANQAAYWNDDLLHASHKVVQLLQDSSNSPEARLVNISGRQRMLSQRLAKFYMLQVWGFNTLTIRDEVERAEIEFTGALETLLAAPETTEAIRRQLDAVSGEWTWFQKALDMTNTDPFPVTVSSATESILLRMDQITRMYQTLIDTVLYEFDIIF
jgi:nitrate/nitrite-specific signal transduction histidine kinase